MYTPSEKVICVDDSYPNPLCQFPCGYVVRGHIYHVRGITITGGVQIEGLPVIGIIHHRFDRKHDGDVGWKPHRFRKYEVRSSDEAMDDPLELELVGAGRDR